jgi:hypothetical protein
MTRKTLARRIVELLFNEPATRRGAGAAQPEGLRGFWPGALLLVGQKTTAGIPPSPQVGANQTVKAGLVIPFPTFSPVEIEQHQRRDRKTQPGRNQQPWNIE